MELSPRLRAVAELTPQGARLADVGTDHGYLPVWLILNGRLTSAVASDLRPGPLDRARATARRYGVDERISFRLCDGLTGISPQEADTVVLAGMGGETIAAVLEAAPWTKRDTLLLLQPMTSFPDLRAWLQSHGYAIETERIACDGKRLYSIWAVRGGDMSPLTEAEKWAGRQSGDPLRRDYVVMIAGKVERALRGELSSAAPNEERVGYLRDLLTELRNMEEKIS